MKKPNYPTVTATVIDEDTMRYGGSAFKRERTCKPVKEYGEGTPYPHLICSECGRSLHWDETVNEYGEDSGELQPYCGCGARVERDA